MENDEHAQIGIFGVCYYLEWLCDKYPTSFYEKVSKNKKIRSIIIKEMDKKINYGYSHVDPVWSFVDVIYFIQTYSVDIAREIVADNLTSKVLYLYECVIDMEKCDRY